MATARRRSRKKTSPTRIWAWILGLAAVAAAAGMGALVWSRTGSGQAALLNLGAEKLYGEVQTHVETALLECLPDLEPGPVAAAEAADAHDWPLPGGDPGAAIRCRVAPVSGDAAWWQVQARITEAVGAVGGQVLWGERLARRRNRGPDERRDLLRLDLGVPGRPTHTLVLYRDGTTRPAVRWGGDPAASAWRGLQRRSAGAVVAIVIDDWGYRRDAVTRGLLELPAPMTMSVLPGLAYSRHFALEGTELALPSTAGTSGGADAAAPRRRAAGCPVTLGVDADAVAPRDRRREIILHLPMQPQGYPDVDPGPRALLVDMPRRRIGALLDDALQALPNVRGVNNHMGSAATADEATMRSLMAELKARDLFFLDSLTTARSVAGDEARAAGLPTVTNRIFLDHDHQDPASIRRRLHRLAESARASGFAVGIGHPHPATLDVLRAEIPRLAANGVVFVTISELLALQSERIADGG